MLNATTGYSIPGNNQVFNYSLWTRFPAWSNLPCATAFVHALGYLRNPFAAPRFFLPSPGRSSQSGHWDCAAPGWSMRPGTARSQRCDPFTSCSPCDLWKSLETEGLEERRHLNPTEHVAPKAGLALKRVLCLQQTHPQQVLQDRHQLGSPCHLGYTSGKGEKGPLMHPRVQSHCLGTCFSSILLFLLPFSSAATSVRYTPATGYQ